MQLRPYQIELSNKASQIIKKNGLAILSFAVRTGKTHISLETCKLIGSKHVLFLTKKKAIPSIQNDYKDAGHTFKLTVINYESIHKITDHSYDTIICDESHTLGAFPKPSVRTKLLKELVGTKRLILMSGTLTPESYSQLYHQLWISIFTPFEEPTFYKWAKVYVDVTKKKINGYDINDYTRANIKLIDAKIAPYILSFTQEQAGFTTNVKDHIHTVEMDKRTYYLANKLRKELVLENNKGDVILADTPVKLQQKLHQIYSGTVLTEEGEGLVLDTSKCDYINKTFPNTKLAIFYLYKTELKAIQQNIENITTDLDEFNSTDKHIALQVVSGREGISLKNADVIVMYNIAFSNVSYIQSRDRMTTMHRKENDVHWLFSKDGMEHEIYKTITKKKAKFTNYYFKNWEKQRGKYSHA